MSQSCIFVRANGVKKGNVFKKAVLCYRARSLEGRDSERSLRSIVAMDENGQVKCNSLRPRMSTPAIENVAPSTYVYGDSNRPLSSSTLRKVATG